MGDNTVNIDNSVRSHIIVGGHQREEIIFEGTLLTVGEGNCQIKQGLIGEVVFQVGEVEIVVVEHLCVCCFRHRMNIIIAIGQRYGSLLDDKHSERLLLMFQSCGRFGCR